MPASMIAVAAHEATEVVVTPKAAEQTVFRSKLPDIPIDNHLPLHTYLLEKASEFADSPCLISGETGRVYTFAETFLLCRRTACGLSRLGVKQHDVVFLLLPNCPEFAFSFLAASMLGAATTTANPFFTPAEIYKQYKASGATLVVTQAAYVDKLRDGRFGEGLTVVTVDEPPHGCVAFGDLVAGEKEEELPEVVIRPDDPVTIPFSSGTTGLPKGVVLTHRSLVTNIAQQVDGENPNVHLAPGDVMLCVLPLFHIFSLSEVLMCSLRSGAAVLLMAKFEMGLMLELVQRWKVTAAAVVPPLVLALAKSKEVEKCDLSSVRLVLSGAAPIGKELLDSLQQRMPHAVFGQGYGMTEAGPAISMSSAFAKDPFSAKSGSCGIIVRNAELKVVDPETGLSLRRNQHGEICIRGPQIMKGYLNAPEATAAIIDSQGWLHTGDIGYVDDDLEVFIVDRVKELIKFKCFQVAPAELEALLITHPSISDAAVVPLKDEVAGEIPVAFVVRSQGADLTEEAVKQFVAKQVVFYKRVHKIYFVQSIPKSVSGKILRKELRARLDASA